MTTKAEAIEAAARVYAGTVADLTYLAATQGAEAVADLVHRPGSRMTPQEIAERWRTPEARAA